MVAESARVATTTASPSSIGAGSLYGFGVAPTVLVAMILAVAYDQRFATRSTIRRSQKVQAAAS
jgi:hypothetical protein